jgi:hypothetical protein
MGHIFKFGQLGVSSLCLELTTQENTEFVISAMINRGASLHHDIVQPRKGSNSWVEDRYFKRPDMSLHLPQLDSNSKNVKQAPSYVATHRVVTAKIFPGAMAIWFSQSFY